MAGTTGLEPATSAVTGQRSNQLSYVPRRNPEFIRRLKRDVVQIASEICALPQSCEHQPFIALEARATTFVQHFVQGRFQQNLIAAPEAQNGMTDPSHAPGGET
jgi:hypothetical protein